MDTRERLIESTQELLWERGYVGTSPAAILQRAQVGQGSMYHHFRGKSELAQAAMERTAESMRSRIAADISTQGTALERIRAYLHRERDVLAGCPVGRMALDPEIYADVAACAPLDGTFHWITDTIRDVLDEGKAAGEFRDDLPSGPVATTLLAVVQGGYVLARASHDPGRFDEAVEGALDLLLAFATDQRQ